MLKTLCLPLVLLLCSWISRLEAQELARLAEAQDWSVAGDLLSRASKDDVNASQADGMTALHWAAFHGHNETVEALLSAGADPNAQTIYQITPLSIACLHGHGEIVATLLSHGAKPNVTQAGGTTPLMLAARVGTPKSIEALLSYETDVNASDRNAQTALMWAAAEGRAEACRLLLAAGADPKQTTKTGFTAWFFAARHGQQGVIDVLLAHGQDINEAIRVDNNDARAPRDEMSALLFAVESGHLELAVHLVEQGADPNDQRSGFTPLHALSWVRRANYGDGVDGDPTPRIDGELSSLEFVRRMVALGADVNAQLEEGGGGRGVLKKKGMTPFLLACKTGDLALLKLLHELGADPHLPNADGTTPLLASAGVGVPTVDEEPATEEEVIETIKYLVHHGADVNLVDANKETAMHGAAYRNYPRVVALLDELGCVPETWNHKNKFGWTPFLIAEGYRPGSLKPSPPTMAALRQILPQ